MKIAVTTEGPERDAPVDPRFGRAPYFVIFDTGSDAIDVIDNRPNMNAMQGAGIQSARIMIDRGVAAVVTGHVGPKAFEVLQAGGVTVYTDADGTAAAALDQCRNGALARQKIAECRGQGRGHRHGGCGSCADPAA